MKSPRLILAAFSFVSCACIVGCASSSYTSPYHPGGVTGQAVGSTAGVVAGNVVAAGVGVVEGAAAGVAAPLDPSYHMVRKWKTVNTADGRQVQVPVDILVDKYGRPVTAPPPTGNLPAPSAPLPVPAPVAPIR